MNAELKKVLGQVKSAQAKFQKAVNSQDWVEEARKYAEKQGKEVRKLFRADISKVKTFLEKERKELEKFQKQIPSEVEKLKTFVTGQRKELKKLIASLRASTKKGGKARKTGTRKAKTTSKKASEAASST